MVFKMWKVQERRTHFSCFEKSSAASSSSQLSSHRCSLPSFAFEPLVCSASSWGQSGYCRVSLVVRGECLCVWSIPSTGKSSNSSSSSKTWGFAWGGACSGASAFWVVGFDIVGDVIDREDRRVDRWRCGRWMWQL